MIGGAADQDVQRDAQTGDHYRAPQLLWAGSGALWLCQSVMVPTLNGSPQDLSNQKAHRVHLLLPLCLHWGGGVTDGDGDGDVKVLAQVANFGLGKGDENRWRSICRFLRVSSDWK